MDIRYVSIFGCKSQPKFGASDKYNISFERIISTSTKLKRNEYLIMQMKYVENKIVESLNEEINILIVKRLQKEKKRVFKCYYYMFINNCIFIVQDENLPIKLETISK